MTDTLAEGGQVFVVATRIAQLDQNGQPLSGESVFVTDTLMKCTFTPVLETGDDIAIKQASGDLSVFTKHGDMVKHGTVNLEITRPDPYLEQACAGGVVFNDTSPALGPPSAGDPSFQHLATGGTLAAATYGYKFTNYTTYGETTASAETTVATTGATSRVYIQFGAGSFQMGAYGLQVYGRTPGNEGVLANIIDIGQQTADAVAAATITAVGFSAHPLTKPIPAGYTFTINGDTNTPPIFFVTTEEAGIGAESVNVESIAVATMIASAVLLPTFIDTGAATPGGFPPLVDLSGGPGNDVGYQSPVLGPVANPNGVSLEFWAKRIKDGYQATDYPFEHWVFPRCANMHIMPRDFTNANIATIMEGDVFQNSNWGSGPAGDFPFDSTKWYQRKACGALTVPTPSVVPVAALY